MKKLREIAKSHYEASSKEVQDQVREVFATLDRDGDGKVDFNEFSDFMREKSSYWFRVLDSDGNGTLDFWEVMTFYYIIQSGRPFCDVCGGLIADEFFTCVPCYVSPGTTFDTCLACYKKGSFHHTHNGRRQFLDSYTMLSNLRRSHIAAQQSPSAGAQAPQPRPSTSYAIVPADGRMSSVANASQTISSVVSIASNIANLVSTVASSTFCTIM